jgi:cyclophilin family peptidyl-prolyl cis-trans isomerase
MVIPEAKTKSGDPLPLYAADYNDLEVKRGAVGMRVQSFGQNDVHLIGSQFSIAVGPTRDPLFSHVFGYVVDGLTVCDAICRLDPSKHRIVVTDCGEMEPKMMESLME